jgi:hypothetical protein
MIQKFAIATALIAASGLPAFAHEITAEHVHAGPVVFEALPLPLIAFGLVGIAVFGGAKLLQRQRSNSTKRDEQ